MTKSVVKPQHSARVHDLYRHFREHGKTPEEKLGWTDAQQPQNNFNVLFDTIEELQLPMAGLTLHDVGCGHGALLNALGQRGQTSEFVQLPKRYLGSDFSTDALNIAMDNAARGGCSSSAVQFTRWDMRKPTYKELHSDLVVVLGSFAFYRPRQIEALLGELWGTTKVGLAFTLWWALDERHLMFEEQELMHRCVNRFIKGSRAPVIITKPGTSYGMPTEQFFMLLK